MFKLCTISLFQEDDLPGVDFVLVWDSKSELSALDSTKVKRDTFEFNLEQEGLELSRQQHLETGLHFVKIYAPMEVLKRYVYIFSYMST